MTGSRPHARRVSPASPICASPASRSSPIPTASARGRFTFRGRTVSEPIAPGHPHALHGHGWRLPWQVTAQSDDGLTMAYEHRADPAGWPWAYRAWQRLALTPQALSVAMGMENRAAEAMPAGLGHHPYFPRTKQSLVSAAIAGIWWPEAGQLPVERVVPPAAADPRTGVAVDSVSLDHGYAGWNGSARIEWPERRAGLTMTADSALSTLVIYSPPDSAFFCVEPVSHCIDAFNLAAQGMSDTGMRVLAPGESWETTVRFTPETPAADATTPRRLEPVGGEGNAAQTDAGGVEDGVGESPRRPDGSRARRRLAAAARGGRRGRCRSPRAPR